MLGEGSEAEGSEATSLEPGWRDCMLMCQKT